MATLTVNTGISSFTSAPPLGSHMRVNTGISAFTSAPPLGSHMRVGLSVNSFGIVGGSPEVTIESNISQGFINDNATITVTVDPVGEFAASQVEFFVNGISELVDTTAPYTHQITLQNGINTVYAVATDELLQTGQSETIEVSGVGIVPIGNGSSRAFNDAVFDQTINNQNYQFIQELWITPDGNISNTDTGGLTRVQKWLKKDGSQIFYKIVV